MILCGMIQTVFKIESDLSDFLKFCYKFNQAIIKKLKLEVKSEILFRNLQSLVAIIKQLF